jgi:hypothetical protein
VTSITVYSVPRIQPNTKRLKTRDNVLDVEFPVVYTVRAKSFCVALAAVAPSATWDKAWPQGPTPLRLLGEGKRRHFTFRRRDNACPFFFVPCQRRTDDAAPVFSYGDWR